MSFHSGQKQKFYFWGFLFITIKKMYCFTFKEDQMSWISTSTFVRVFTKVQNVLLPPRYTNEMDLTKQNIRLYTSQTTSLCHCLIFTFSFIFFVHAFALSEAIYRHLPVFQRFMLVHSVSCYKLSLFTKAWLQNV